jgi:hypothetical protein
LLKEGKAIALPTESEQRDYECIVIDISEKAIYLSQSICELWEQAASRWPDYSCYMVDYGYLDTLKRASIDTIILKMSQEQAIELLSEFLGNTREINPAGIAKNSREKGKISPFIQTFLIPISRNELINHWNSSIEITALYSLNGLGIYSSAGNRPFPLE